MACYFVLVGFVVGNLLFSLIVVLFWNAQHETHQNKRLPNTNPTKTKQQLKKTKDCPTRTPPKQNNNQRKEKIAQPFGGVRVGQSFVFFNCCFVLVGFVLGNPLFSLIVVLFWWGSCWATFCFL
jgi:uncharacterized membrane-anchored protein YitT (DUF2179 family)